MEHKINFIDCSLDEFIDDSCDRKYDSYGLDDCVLVRTTDVFPFGSIIQTPVHGNAYSFDNSSILGGAIFEVLKRNFSDDESRKEYSKYNICYEIFRSTIHFTINGLVSSHIYGNFDDKPYIIIEPLKYHISDDSLCSLNACDTYFNDDMLLSDEAVILISEDKFNEIKDAPLYIDDLNKFKIVVYKGKNQNKAVRDVLVSLGYDYFRIGQHGYKNNGNPKKPAFKMWEYFNVLRKEYQKESIPHFYSEFKLNDNIKRDEKIKEKELEYFYYIINNSNISKETLDIIKVLDEREILSEIDDNTYIRDNYWVKDFMINLVLEIGLDNIYRLTKEFNNIYIEELSNDRKLKR